MKIKMPVRVVVMSPVHIGCAEYYDPTGFIIDTTKNKLIQFDPMEFVSRLTPAERDDFMKACQGSNLLEIMRKIRKYYKSELRTKKEVSVSGSLAGRYAKMLEPSQEIQRGASSAKDNKGVINDLSIDRTAFLPYSELPYIPGSALKGAIRTAYLNALAKKMRLEGIDDNRQLEERLLGGTFNRDPFRYLKVSDLLPAGEVSTKIIYAVNKKKSGTKKTQAETKIPQILEVIEKGSVFKGEIDFEYSPVRSKEAREYFSRFLPSQDIHPGNVLEWLNDFYLKIAKEEQTLYAQMGLKFSLDLKAFNKASEQEVRRFILRLGRHSGAESVTIEGNRKIKIMQGKGKRPVIGKKATTIWLSSSLHPGDRKEGTPVDDLEAFGWIELCISASETKVIR